MFDNPHVLVADSELPDLIECGPYVTGANFSGVRPYLDNLVDLGFPIAEIAHDGTAIITKNPLHGGFVDELNVRAQFLYEIQGTEYINPDVLADIGSVRIENTESGDRVRVSGAKGSPPPATTKAMTVAIGGYLAEATFYMNGLDLDAKERFMRQQIEHAFQDSNFAELSIERYGAASSNPSNQAMGTISIRVLVKANERDDIREDVFRKNLYALRMQFYAGEKPAVAISALTAIRCFTSSYKTGKADRMNPSQVITCLLTSEPCLLGCLWSFSLAPSHTKGCLTAW
jgi:hypothetical protein